MVRTLIFNFLLLAATCVALADDQTAKSASAATTTLAAASVPAASAEAADPLAATKPGANREPATKADDKAEPRAATDPAAQPGGDVKMSGMSILGNEDAPKSLVLVPWKSSRLADMPTVSRLLDSAAQPVDKDVFMRELAYYEFKSSSK
jgi:hypothetical protein